MSKSIVALALALSVLPLAAAAQNAGAPPQPSDAQRQQMRAQFQQFAQQEAQLHDRMRMVILASLTPVHRRAIAAEIGNLAVSPNPDLDAAAKRIDAMLTSYERGRIMAAHSAFVQQSRQLHDQLRAAMRSEMPAGAPPMRGHMMNGQWHGQLDVGHIVLGELQPHPHGMMGGMMPPQGGPPPQ